MEDPQLHMTVVSRHRSSEESDATGTHHHSHSGEHHHSHSGEHHHSHSGEHHHSHSGEHHHSRSGEHHHSHSGEHHHSRSGEHHHSRSHRYQDYGSVNLGTLTEHLDQVIAQENVPEPQPVSADPSPATAYGARDVLKQYGPILTRKYRKRHGSLTFSLVAGLIVILLLGLLIFFIWKGKPNTSDSATFSPIETQEVIYD